MFLLYFNFGISIVRIKNIIQTFKSLISKNMDFEKGLRVTINVYKKQCFLVTTWNRKTFIKASCTNKTDIGENFISIFDNLKGL